MNSEQRLFAETVFAQNLNVLHHAYIDISDGNINAGLLLSQILYWFAPDKNGVQRVRVERDGIKYLVKSRTDWFDECRLSPKQFDNASKILKSKGFIETKTMKFNGNPTTHISINAGAINAAIEAWKANQVAQHFAEPAEKTPENPDSTGFQPKGNNDVPDEEILLLPKGEQGDSRIGNNDIPMKGISSYTDTTNKEFDIEHVQPNGENVHFTNHQETMNFIDEEFEKVWNEYPKKEGKQKAKKAFEKAIRGMSTRKPNGSPFTPEEILVQVVLFRQYVESMIETGEMTRRFVPTGGSWFENESWLDEFPSISSKLESFEEGIEFNRNCVSMRQIVHMIPEAPEPKRIELKNKLKTLLSAMPY